MSADRGAQARFGTFGGVFTPCTLTILGVIMFMRSGYVVGDVGVWKAILILGIAKAITTLTTMSLSVIATNTEVKTGGVYFMISRTLGPDFGGAIGLTLYVSQAVSIAFYVIGFSEALFGLFSADVQATVEAYRIAQIVSSVVIVGLFLVTFKGADVALKAQYVILGILLISVASFVIGGIAGFDAGNFADNQGALEAYVPDAANPDRVITSDGFWIAFAIFFPAATGITAGANMSGDLKDPGKSIPRGTLLAIGFTASIYLLQLILLAGFEDQQHLREGPFQAMKDMSIWAPLVIAGVFAATLSSALGSFLGAPRILQAMGKDRLLKSLIYFGKGHGPADEPRRATVMSLGIALAVIWAGGLDAVAKVISMFFLIAYGMINLSAFVEGKGGNPSFRPRFKLFGWPAALAGTIGCAIAMVKIDETYALVAMSIAAAVYFSLRGRVESSFGNAKRGYIFSRTRENLLLLERMAPDPKNWRPVLVVITEDAERDKQLIRCASWIESGRGLLSVLEVVAEPEKDMLERLNDRASKMIHLKHQLAAKGVVAFADSVVLPETRAELDSILQAYSIGSLRPNTLMFSVAPPNQPERRNHVAAWLNTAAKFGLNIVVYKGARMGSARNKQIDIWWHGHRNGSVMTLFAYLASVHPDWPKAKIRMLRIVTTGEEHLEAESSLRAMMEAARVTVDVEVVLSQRPVLELIAEKSGQSDLVFLGLRQQDVEDIGGYLAKMDPLLAKLPPTLLVLSNGEADLLA